MKGETIEWNETVRWNETLGVTENSEEREMWLEIKRAKCHRIGQIEALDANTQQTNQGRRA